MQNKITYFTFNDPPSGVYNSQVIEVVKYLNTLDSKLTVQLLAIISPRGFRTNRAKIKQLNQQAVVLPALAPLKYWQQNKLLLWLIKPFLTTRKIICRGPMATCLAIDVFKNKSVVYDGRGAVFAEHEEYAVFEGSGIENQLFAIEEKAVLKSHFRIAVTLQLTEYWKEKFGYASNQHVVIPCTVSQSKRLSPIPDEVKSFIEANKNKTLFTFAGGNGKWQGIDLLVSFLTQQLQANKQAAALLLCPATDELLNFQRQFPKQVLLTTVEPDQVHTAISLCDYGLLLRHQTITNSVASPVKVAEYLMAGLKVIISPNIGDYSSFIQQENCGWVDRDNDHVALKKITREKRQHNQAMAQKYFSKNSTTVISAYKKVYG
ncbi:MULTISPECIES: glycosyl transferase [unclassified Carboxylicivirga]|uniref:glycosyl transferase n=1 Tax=Carboxylicivirga TaxID=1628153 RepID=UPI003D339ADA